MRKPRIAFACAAALAGLAAQSAHAVTIWGVDNLGTTNAATVGDRIVRFDSSNPAGTIVTVGSTGVAATLMSGLDFAPDGNLYAVSQPSTGTNGGIGGGGNLYRISQVNGAATLIGSLNLPANVGRVLTDLSWNPVTGVMTAVSLQDLDTTAGFNPQHRLYTVALGSGNATDLGIITGLPTGALDVGMASNSLGVNFVHNIGDDRMYQLAGTLATGMPSVIGVNTNFSQGMTMNWQGANEWYLAAIGNTPAFFSQIMQINNATGVGTIVPGGIFPLNGGTALPEYELGDIAIPIPEPASLGLIAVAATALIRRLRA